MKRGILIFFALSAALSAAWPNGAQEGPSKKERALKAPKKSPPLVFSYLQDKPFYTVKIPPPGAGALSSAALAATTPPAATSAPATPTATPAPIDPATRVKQTDFKESNPTFASYGCATMAVLGTVQTMTNTQFTKPEVEKIIAKNKENGGFKNDDYTVIWKTTFDTVLTSTGSRSDCVGLVKLDPSGKIIYNDVPKEMSGVFCPLSGPARGVSSGHFVEASLPSGTNTLYNPGITSISTEKKEVLIPLIKMADSPTWDWVDDE